MVLMSGLQNVCDKFFIPGIMGTFYCQMALFSNASLQKVTKRQSTATQNSNINQGQNLQKQKHTIASNQYQKAYIKRYTKQYYLQQILNQNLNQKNDNSFYRTNGIKYDQYDEFLKRYTFTNAYDDTKCSSRFLQQRTLIPSMNNLQDFDRANVNQNSTRLGKLFNNNYCANSTNNSINNFSDVRSYYNQLRQYQKNLHFFDGKNGTQAGGYQRCDNRYQQTLACSSTNDIDAVYYNESKLQRLFNLAGNGNGNGKRKKPLFLERTIGSKLGQDLDLWNTGKFSAEVYPDLPQLSGWRERQKGLGNAAKTNACLLKNQQEAWIDTDVRPSMIADENGNNSYQISRSTDKWLIVSVAAQLRSRSQIRHSLLAACGLDEKGEQQPGHDPADALLLVSGSHPGRQLNGAKKHVQNSLDMLSMAYDMRAEGDIPQSVSLWAVANPNLPGDMDRVYDKMDMGAEVIITQPPFLFTAFTNWLEQDYAREIFQTQSQNSSSSYLESGDDNQGFGKLVVGVPVLTSMKNLKFWFELCGIHKLKDKEDVEQIDSLVNEFQEYLDRGDLFGFNQKFIKSVLQLSAVAGVHVMPINQEGRQLTFQLLEEDVFGQDEQVMLG
eukprot:TRINITY_DN3363_c0_g1_i5.p1 TRINITY_DN3363_c0_g1~~TRINITY_DN3363_c0_g1_i5.p1  ORF type:complete len:610 (-),score=76.64 TRINITY_DN3363_c0_g1_i5:117-1946(-)